MKKISIEKGVLDQFPSTHVGIVVAKNICNNTNVEGIEFVLRESENQVRTRHEGKALLDLPEMKLWRETYKAFGAKKGRRVSIEAMLKRVLKGKAIPLINPLVDLYNAVSLRHLFPCGGEDLNHIMGDVVLGIARGDESFKTIGSDVNEPPNPGEVVYKDEAGCLCRCWNWREADRTKLTEETTHAILVIESLDASRVDEMKGAMDHLSTLVVEFLNAETQTAILNAENPIMKIEL